MPRNKRFFFTVPKGLADASPAEITAFAALISKEIGERFDFSSSHQESEDERTEDDDEE
jgi:hypothetical protein